MRREGSALHGLGVVIMKELSDHLTSARMRVLEWLVVLVALAALYGAIQQIKDVTAEDPFLFLRLFTTARESIPITFVSFVSILVPLMAIGLGFDAINSEHNRRTLSRVLAQPIYRDALLFGKFIAGLLTLSISLRIGCPWACRFPHWSAPVSACASKWITPTFRGHTCRETAAALGYVIE